MKIFKARSKRSKAFAVITFLLITVLFGLNLLLSIVGLKKTVYIDMTPEELYSVSDRMIEECEFLNELDGEKEVKIIFCNDPDKLIGSTVTRTTYFMALKLQKRFDNVKVEAENVNYNPTKVAKYKATSLSEIKTSDVIIAYGDRYRIVSAEAFWATSDGGTEFTFYDGEYKLASFLKSVTRANGGDPAAYFVIGHGETAYNKNDLESAGTLAAEQFKNLLLDRGLRVETIKLSDVEKIPDDCALLIINNPTEDYKPSEKDLDSFFYVSDLEKIDRYLTVDGGSLMISKDPARSLPELERYLREWGFAFSTSTLKVPTDTDDPEASEKTDVMKGVYITDTDSYAYAVYGEFAALSSSPKTVLSGAGDINNAFGASNTVVESGAFDIEKTYTSFIKAPSNATPYDADGNRTKEEESYDIAAVSVRTSFDNVTAETSYSYVFCANDADIFSNESLGNAAYANYEIMSALITNISRRDLYASMDLGGTSLNSEKIGGKKLVSTALSTEYKEEASIDGEEMVVTKGITTATLIIIPIIVAVLPIAALTMGVITHVKRKYK